MNGEGIFDSKPWVKAASSPEVRFTRKNDSLYAYVQATPGASAITIPGVAVAHKDTKIRVLGATTDSEFKQHSKELVILAKPGGAYATGVRITPIPNSV